MQRIYQPLNFGKSTLLIFHSINQRGVPHKLIGVGGDELDVPPPICIDLDRIRSRLVPVIALTLAVRGETGLVSVLIRMLAVKAQEPNPRHF